MAKTSVIAIDIEPRLRRIFQVSTTHRRTGADLREPTEHLLLFEEIISLAPDARICSNSNPADTIGAVRRWTKT